jgi:hypothetical protein
MVVFFVIVTRIGYRLHDAGLMMHDTRYRIQNDKNPKSQALNPKQIKNSNSKNSKRKPQRT